ncbi:NAD(P)/FAD-dependent oxidoreductase [Archangium violaceum]|uniref:NAD(P)/FAD-dependent oxidoreductase n=1 Tax=Archangium violaceum TaxID=83451 RepID=UPI00193B5B5E|nr:NAD(P)/FAD-dependent oxidoreductase [Archangium violaceum]QRK13082.1 NAD(P)/FAD-dependent oxidoreductase [Archangium violaceum]
MKSLHVAIVGAGPAGSSAATFLAQQGARVTLLERGRFPRDKICGDGCTPRTLWMLERLGLGTLPGSETEAAPVDAIYAISPGGVVLDMAIPTRLFGGKASVIPRQVLDERLVQRAVQSGAKLREGVRVEGIEREANGIVLRCRDGEAVRADLVLGCDGSPSVVRRALGAPDFPDHEGAFAVRAYYENVRLSRPRSMAFYWEKELLPAYGWIFPLPDGRANVGLGLRADQLAASGAKLPELMERFCASPHVAAELAGARRVGKVKGHHLPFGSFARHTHFDRALLLGDAAGFVNPLTGEGIEFALESGAFAAEAVAEAVAAGDLSARGLGGYARRWQTRFRTAFQLNRKLMFAFERPRLLDRTFRAAIRNERVRDELADVISGEASSISWRFLAGVALGR